MMRSLNRRFAKGSTRSRRKALQYPSQRSLRAERLERRLLLTTVTSVDPLANSHNVPLSTNVSATFDMDVNAGTVTADTFVVHGTRSGLLVDTTVSAAGPVITHNPTGNFSPGERVRVTVTSGITTTGGAANPHVWQFNTEVSSGSGQFEVSGQVFANSNQGEQAAFGDVDGDGDLDLLEGSEYLWLNDGTGVFTNSGQTMALNCTNSCGQGGGIEPRFADLDGDGDLDIAGTGSISLNNGSGIFTDTGQNLDGGSTISVGDLDADGDIDLMQGLAYGPSRVWFNNGNAQFTNSGQSLGNAAFGFEFGDFDNDGDLDAFAANNGPPDSVWINDGSGVFTDSGQALGNFRSTREVDVADIDGDGDLDAVTTAENDGTPTGTRVWVNDGGGNFTETLPALDPPLRGRTVEFGDLDADGDLDMVVANLWNPGTRVWLNDGSGGFSSGQQLSFSSDNVARRVEGGALGDVDGDGDLDYWEANVGTGGSRLWINQNLQPSVALSVDAASIAENAGVSTVTATLSAVHTQPVTIDLAFSGTATDGDDYTKSGSQIVIAAGVTTGTVTITGADDSADEPDESVVVDIASVANADEAGTQQVTVTILDDDEPIPVPDITLAVDNAAIPENAGVATFTANLSVPTTVPVTIDFGISGTAAASDFASSATQIVVAPGATSGTLTVTAVQDAVDEPDETVIVDIASVTGGNEVGSQQQTTTITDDDEPVMPDVTLVVDNTSIPEAAGVATFTLALSEATTAQVMVDLAITGTATAADYSVSATQITFEAGTTTAAVAVTAVQDEADEPDETVIIDIASVAGGNELGEQQQTTTILDDDIPPSFVVTGLTSTDSGFEIELNNPLDGDDINLYDTQNAGLGAADVTVTGAASGAIAGSLIIGNPSVTFIASGGPLAADTYTVTLRSGTDAFEDTGGQLLDGNADGTGGDDYVATFTVDAAPAGARTLSLPDFVRGPGQDVNLPADGTTGIPISISEGDNVRAADIRISYDPALLEITGATAPAGGTVVLNTTTTPGVAILVYFATASLPAGPSTFINLQATVPAGSASAIYREQQVLDVHDVIIGDGNDNEFEVQVDDALHFVTFFADTSGNGRINASDAAQDARFAALLDSGFAASLNTDPVVIGDISGNGRINAADASRIAQFAALIPVPEIPAVPGGVVIAGVRTGEPVAPFADPGELETRVVTSDPNAAPADTGVAESDAAAFQVVSNFSSAESEAAIMHNRAVDRATAELAVGELREVGLSLALEEALNELLQSFQS